MSKVKMRCTVCGKWFQSANAKEVTCPDCVQKARKEKMAAKNTPLATQKAPGTANTKAGVSRSPAPPPKPKQQVQSGTNQWLDKLEDVKVSQPEPPPVRPKSPSPPVQRDQHAGQGMAGNLDSTKPQTYRRDEHERGPGNYRPGGSGQATGPGQRPRVPQEGGPAHGGYKPAHAGEKGGRPQGGPRGKYKSHTPKEPAPPKPPREKIPPPPPFVPTPEQIKQVEERYLELAQPIEFDGIRTQIANELQIPKKAVKQIVKNLRVESHIPSWWELQTYKGSTEELEKIKAVYEPYLPLPPIGVHKNIAEELSLKASVVYQAIKTIRQELGLPQYNDPALHEHERVENAAEAGSEQTSVSTPPEGELAQPVPVSTPPEDELAQPVPVSTPPENELAQPVPVSAPPEGELAQPAPVSADQVSSSSES